VRPSNGCTGLFLDHWDLTFGVLVISAQTDKDFLKNALFWSSVRRLYRGICRPKQTGESITHLARVYISTNCPLVVETREISHLKLPDECVQPNVTIVIENVREFATMTKDLHTPGN